MLGDEISSDIEGVSNINACYGGTAALFNSIAWLESSEWDGRYALVVCGDIAVYEEGPARPTGGCGAIAMLLGPDAPLVLESGVRSSHVLDVYDFYKPNNSEYALVDGKLSQYAYLSSVDNCYKRYKAKYQAKHPSCAPINADHFDYFAFHSPYNKLVQKGFSRLLFCDYLDSSLPTEEANAVDASFKSMPINETYENRHVEAAFRTASNNRFEARVMPCCKINQNIGNCYTGSVFSSLLSVIAEQGNSLVDKRVLMFSYGSGSVATLYSFIGKVAAASSSPFSLTRMQSVTNIAERLQHRKRASHEDFTKALSLRAAKYGKAPMAPDGLVDNVAQGVYYLSAVSDRHHRSYIRNT